MSQRARIFCESRPVEFVSVYDPHIDWTRTAKALGVEGGDAAREQYVTDPLAIRSKLVCNGKAVGWWCRAATREDMAIFDAAAAGITIGLGDPLPGETAEERARRATPEETRRLVAHNRHVAAGLFGRCLVAVSHLETRGMVSVSHYEEGEPRFDEPNLLERRLTDADWTTDEDGQRCLTLVAIREFGAIAHEIGGYLRDLATLSESRGNDSGSPSG